MKKNGSSETEECVKDSLRLTISSYSSTYFGNFLAPNSLKSQNEIERPLEMIQVN